MDKKLKFKVWDKINKCFTDYVEYENGQGEGRACININGDLCAESPTGFDSIKEGVYEIVQYSGLEDKNGKEVYKGDILEAGIKPARHFEVKHGVYEDAYGAFDEGHIGFYTDKWGTLPDVLEEGATVVGNVYEPNHFNVE